MPDGVDGFAGANGEVVAGLVEGVIVVAREGPADEDVVVFGKGACWGVDAVGGTEGLVECRAYAAIGVDV